MTRNVTTLLSLASLTSLTTGSAMADYNVEFQLDGPSGNTIEQTHELTGSLAGASIEVNFSTDEYGWASDLLIGFVDPNGNSAEFGGFDMSFGFPSAGEFPREWDTWASGVYAHSFSLEEMGLSGEGTWTIMFMDGYIDGTASEHWDGVLTLEGVVPAPGALALLGLAGFARKRRRRAPVHS